MEEAAGGAVVGKEGQLDACFGAVGDFHHGLRTAHVRLDPAGMRGVDLDLCIAQLVGKVDGEGVDGGLGGVVSEGFGVVDRRAGFGVQGERAEDAGQIDDAAGRAALDERQQGLGERDDGEEVGFKDAAEQVEGHVGGVVLRSSAGEGAGGNASVVDEDVETAVAGVEVAVSGLAAGGVGDVELDHAGLYACSRQFVESLLPLCERTGSEVGVNTGQTELLDGFKADAAVGAGDECDLLRHKQRTPGLFGLGRRGKRYRE